MYIRVIPIYMGRSIERQDGEDFKRGVSGHFQTGTASDSFTDKGTEFTNRVFQKMWKYFTHRETLTYVYVLSEMVASYNHTVHRTIGIPPAEVTWANQTTVSKRLYGRKRPK